MKSHKLRAIINCAIFAAITAVLAQVEIPLPVVPISGQTLAVGLTATILGSRYGMKFHSNERMISNIP